MITCGARGDSIDYIYCAFMYIYIYLFEAVIYIYRCVCVNTIINGVEHDAHTPRKTGPFVGYIFSPVAISLRDRTDRHYIIIGRDVCYYVSLLWDTIIIIYDIMYTRI